MRLSEVMTEESPWFLFLCRFIMYLTAMMKFAQDEPYHIDTMGLYFPNENTISVRLIENVNNDVGVFIYNVNDNYLLQLLVIDATGL